MSSNYGFEPTLDGLNNIDADTSTTTNIICDTIIINTSGTAPTRIAGDNTTNIANTEFVTSAITTAGTNYVTLSTDQTITGEKLFTGAVEVGPATLTTLDINCSGLIDCNDIYINGQLNFGSVTINESGVGDLEMNNLTNGGKYIFKADDSGGTSREALNLSASTATFNGTIVAPGATFNTALPTSTLTPSTSTQLTTKAYVDSVSGGGVSLAGTNVWTGTNTFNTNLPTSTLTPSTSSQLTTKTYVDTAITTGTSNLLAGTNVWTGTNTFNTNLPTSTLTPSTSTQLTTKTYVDSAITTAGSGYVTLSGTQSITGEKTLSNANTFITGNTVTDSVQSSAVGATQNIATTQTTGVLNIGTLGARSGTININTGGTSSANVNISTASTSSSTVAIGSATTLVSVGGVTTFTNTTPASFTFGVNTSTINGVVTSSMNLATTQTSGVLNLGTLGARTGAVNINTGATSTAPVNISSGTNANAPITIGSTGSTTQTCAMNGITSFSNTTTFNAKATVNNSEFAIRASSADKLTINYVIDRIDIQTKVAGEYVNFTVSDSTSALQIQDSTLDSTYQKADIVIPETTAINIIPAGTILTSVVSTAPEGYVLCDGTSYSSTNVATNKYRRLFNAIGYTFGGSGASFNVPNFLGAVLKSQGSQVSGGVTYSGASLGTAQADAVQTPLTASNQGWRGAAAGTRECVSRAIITSDPVDTTTGILPRFTRTATDNRVFTYSVYYYIKF